MTPRSVSAKYPGLEVNYGPGVRYSGKDLGARKIFREKTLIYTSRLLPTSRSILTQLQQKWGLRREIKFQFTLSRVDIFRVMGCDIRMGKSVRPPCNKVM